MTDHVAEGWLWIYSGSDYFKLYFKNALVDYVFESIIKHYEGGTHYSYHAGKRWLEFFISELWFTSHADFASFINYIETWMDASSSFTLAISRDGTNFVTWDGTNTSYTVILQKGLEKMERVPCGDQQIYRIRNIILEQTS